MTDIWDVIVIGAGPAGCAAAKRCAEKGRKTLLLERYELPREKVCAGMLLSPASRALIQEEFGEVPQRICSSSPYIRGYVLHIPGTADRTIEMGRVPHAWRREFDYWLIQKALQSGVDLWTNTRVSGIEETDGAYTLKVSQHGAERNVKSKYVIGGDGAASVTRKFCFPDAKLAYGPASRLCYRETALNWTALNMDKEYFHPFFHPQHAPYRFSIEYYGDVFTLIYTKLGKSGEKWVLENGPLATQYRLLDIKEEPIWEDACVELGSHKQILFGTFFPAKDNVLLAGSAAGFMLPVTWEGIGPSLRSGFAAGDAVLKASADGKQAELHYLAEIDGLLTIFKQAYSWGRRIRDATTQEPDRLADTLVNCFEELLFITRW